MREWVLHKGCACRTVNVSEQPTDCFQMFAGDQSSGKDCSCGPPIRLYRGNQTFWTVGKDKRVCHILAMHPSTSREHAAVQFRRTVKGEITPYVIDLNSSNGTYLRNQIEDVGEGVHGGGYDKLDAGRYYRIYSGDVIRLGESQRDYVFIIDDANQN
jgi:pSer/pThr/pTyr-binding forkhead associated (FHA) protein